MAGVVLVYGLMQNLLVCLFIAILGHLRQTRRKNAFNVHESQSKSQNAIKSS